MFIFWVIPELSVGPCLGEKAVKEPPWATGTTLDCTSGRRGQRQELGTERPSAAGAFWAAQLSLFPPASQQFASLSSGIPWPFQRFPISSLQRLFPF